MLDPRASLEGNTTAVRRASWCESSHATPPPAPSLATLPHPCTRSNLRPRGALARAKTCGPPPPLGPRKAGGPPMRTPVPPSPRTRLRPPLQADGARPSSTEAQPWLETAGTCRFGWTRMKCLGLAIAGTRRRPLNSIHRGEAGKTTRRGRRAHDLGFGGTKTRRNLRRDGGPK